MTIQKTSGEIVQYFYGQELTDEELEKINGFFKSAFHEVITKPKIA